MDSPPKPVPTFSFDPSIKSNPPNTKKIIVLEPGSEYLRFGFAGQSNPHKVRSVVAYRRKDSQQPGESRWKRRCDFSAVSRFTHVGGIRYRRKDSFLDSASAINQETEMSGRRTGREMPVSWELDMTEEKEEDGNSHPNAKPTDVKSFAGLEVDESAKVVVGDRADWIADEDIGNYDVVYPICEGHIDSRQYGCGLVRAALDALFGYAVVQLLPERKVLSRPLECSTFVVLIVPENSSRRDIADYCGSVFRCPELAAAALFVHHHSVSCAFGAGLSTCVVIDIGHTGTTISCIDEGTVIPACRVRLGYGGRHVLSAYWRFLNEDSAFYRPDLPDRPKLTPFEIRHVVRISGTQLCGFSAEENDEFFTASVALPTRRIQLKMGLGFFVSPAWGFFYPKLFTNAVVKPREETYYRNADDDNYFADIFDDLKRSTVASAALPVGTFANDVSNLKEVASIPQAIHPTEASLSDAVIWSIDKAVGEVSAQSSSTKVIDLKKRLYGSILLAGGGANLKGASLALEDRLKKTLSKQKKLHFDVTVLEGRGKKDEELAAAAAVVKAGEKIAGLDDDGDPASLPWKGGAVIAQADAAGDMWVYRDEWESRHARAVREKAPFYW